MHIRASAPGKLVVAGDYAVLEGAPAVVLALDRRARVELAPSRDDAFGVDAPDLGIRGVRGHFERGRLHWDTDAGVAAQLVLVAAVLEHFAKHDLAVEPCDMTLDTHDFFDAKAKAKLGLGSSAALTVALAGAVLARNGQATPDTVAMIAMHRQMQGGRGSGLDIATSLLGGTVVYQLREGQPEAVRADWPPALGFCCVWSGRVASTGSALARLADWRRQHPAAYATHMNELVVGAGAIVTALHAGDAEAMAEGMAAYAGGLARLGQASGIDIVCAEHRALADIGRTCGVVYKTCGAGGGDIGMAVATDADRLTHFARQAVSAGFRVLETGVDVHGLSVQTTTSSHRRSAWTISA